MARVVHIRKVVVIDYSKEIVKGATISVEAGGLEKLSGLPNDGRVNVYYPADATGTYHGVVRGSKAGEDPFTVALGGTVED